MRQLVCVTYMYRFNQMSVINRHNGVSCDSGVSLIVHFRGLRPRCRPCSTDLASDSPRYRSRASLVP